MFGGGSGGGSVYWGRKGGEFKGIVVLFAWISIPRNHLKSYVDLYSSLGWNSLVSHADFLSAFYPEKALSLAYILLNELFEELRIRPCPIVFVAFSGGPKACMYKVFQIIQGTCGGHINLDENRLLRNCVSGHIYDSSPLDFTSDLGAQFALPPAIQKMPGPSKLVSWFAKGVTSALDGLYLTRFDSQRAEYWQTLYSSVDFGAPYLVLFSETDHLAPYRSIYRFAQRLQDLGGDVKLVKWNVSPHIGHYKHYPIQYRAAVTNLLEKAASVYSRRIQQLRAGNGLDGMHDEISELICNLQKAAVYSNQSLRRVAVEPGDHFFVPTSTEYHNNRESEPLQDGRKVTTIYLPPSPSINANSVLGQLLFDVCVPKNVEGWDIRFSGSLNGHPIASARMHSPVKGIKCIRRSRL
ncbi:hypothetical protein P3X46_013899 [Hevea brasiliensis]|uniref:Uncharacterized protein n=2 Tax=Hevea brasiliensis TaxID=3981 RepID=A0A6A6L345_HEVBR|nr:uncharacterized protein LOC110665855 [Hevea brasiliensis]KAF2295364.1 hypothetical protein GH714_032669 [Hevea brasiliensis]KAJ9175334.1 hypothetical protein P3X46_013899 [Hevea brasiliensis]